MNVIFLCKVKLVLSKIGTCIVKTLNKNIHSAYVSFNLIKYNVKNSN